jgi:hypothetical protein
MLKWKISSMTRYTSLLAAVLLLPLLPLRGQPHGQSPKTTWHTATSAKLQAALPARAAVEKERIETEMPSATGITDNHGRVDSAVVLITAGYAAQGKYSHYLLLQSTLRLGADITLHPGSYVIGWTRVPEGLRVHIYEANTGHELGVVIAHPQTQGSLVVPIKIWPPNDRSVIQIGRFTIPYTPLD